MGLVSYINPGVMDHNEAFFMHLTPRVVNNFQNLVSVQDFCILHTKRSQIIIWKEPGSSGLSSQQ